MVCCSACSVDIPAGEASGHQRRLHLGPALWTCVGCHFAAPAFPDALAHALLAGHGLRVKNSDAPQQVLSQLGSGSEREVAESSGPLATAAFAAIPAFAAWPQIPRQRQRRGRPPKVPPAYWAPPLVTVTAPGTKSEGVAQGIETGTEAHAKESTDAEEGEPSEQATESLEMSLSQSMLPQETPVSQFGEEADEKSAALVTEKKRRKRKADPSMSEEVEFTCLKCGHAMRSQLKYRGYRAIRHVISCNAIAPYTCSACHVSKARREKLARHIASRCPGAVVEVREQAAKEAAVRQALSDCFPDITLHSWKGL